MNVLLVEDDSIHAQLIQLALARERRVTLHWAKCLRDARSLLVTIGFQLVLLDYNLPDGNGFDLFYDLRAGFALVPIVFLTALNSAEICARAFRGGAVDYVVKKGNYLEDLPRVVRVALKKVPGQASFDTERGTCMRCGFRHPEPPAPPLQPPPDERTLILQALERHHWRRERAAHDLGMSRITLWRKMWKFGLMREGDGASAESPRSFGPCT